MQGDQESGRKATLSRTAVTGLVVCIVVAVAALLGYFAWRAALPSPTPIGEILADLRTYDGKPVTIRGEVTNTLNVVVLKAFDVTDDSGSIRVVTERGLPRIGSEITVNGIVHEVYNIAGVNYTVVLESPEQR